MPHVFRKTLRLIALTSERRSILVYSIVIVIVRAYGRGADTAHSSHLFKWSVWIVNVISDLFRVKDCIVASAWEIGPIPRWYFWNHTWSALFLNAEIFKVIQDLLIVSWSATCWPIIARWRCSTKILVIFNVTLITVIDILVVIHQNLLAVIGLTLKNKAMSCVFTSCRSHFRGSSYSLIEGPFKLLIEICLKVLLKYVWHLMSVTTFSYFNVAVALGTIVSMMFNLLFRPVARIVWFCTWRWHLVIAAIDANTTQSDRKFWLPPCGAICNLRWSLLLLTTGILSLPGVIFLRFNSLVHNLILTYGLLYQLSLELGNEHFLLNLNDFLFFARFGWILPWMSTQLRFTRRSKLWKVWIDTLLQWMDFVTFPSFELEQFLRGKLYGQALT